MKITIPNIAQPEVEYTFHCLLKEFLGLEYELEVLPSTKDFTISENGKSIVIKNYFFKDGTPESWYHLAEIPKNVSSDFLEINKKNYSIHSIFGKPKMSRVGEDYILETDIIASTFFMLTRWEEAVNPKRDAHQRFSAKDSVAYQNGFLQKPVVNEYVEILWALFEKIGISQKRKVRQFSIIPTHDVDVPFLFPSRWKGLKAIARHLVEPAFFKDGIKYSKFFLKGKDPNDTHHIFLEGAERLETKAYFFFMAGGKNKYDPQDQLSHPKVKQLIQEIKHRGHHIGFHPSYDAYQNADLFNQEKKRLEMEIGQEVKTGRQHYLRFEVPTTWNLWEVANMDWDSSMGYADEIGFRCGVCYSFPVFDFRERKRLNLFEKPLPLMEGTLGMYMKMPLEAARKNVYELLEEVEKYNGEFVFLWHNSAIHFRMFSQHNPILFDFYNQK